MKVLLGFHIYDIPTGRLRTTPISGSEADKQWFVRSSVGMVGLV